MQRVFPITIAWFTLALSSAVAAPARPLYEPEAPPKPPAPVIGDLNGPSWLGNYTAKLQLTFIFEADGTLSYHLMNNGKGTNVVQKSGTWKLEGNSLSFEFVIRNNKLMDFRGVVKTPDTIVGEQTSKAGAKSPMTLQRTKHPLK